MDIKEEKPIAWAEAKKALEKRAEEKELGYEQKNALEFLQKFSKVSERKAKEMAEELEKINKLKPRHIVSIINHLPQTVDELKGILAHEVLNLSEDEHKKILDIIKKIA